MVVVGGAVSNTGTATVVVVVVGAGVVTTGPAQSGAAVVGM